MESILNKIITSTKDKIITYKKEYSLSSLLTNIQKITNFIDFKNEIKKRNSKKKKYQ